jgi:hypothetical protein
MITDFPITLMSYASAPLTRLPKKDAPSPAPAPATAKPATAKPAPASAKPAPVSQPEPASTPSAQEPDGDPQAMPKVKVKIPRVIVIEGYALRRIEGVCGSGDASIDVGSFSGTVHLKKQ